jgi:hypothetical protein
MDKAIALSLALIASITVTCFRIPGYFVLSISFSSDVAITFMIEMAPIWNSVPSN